MSYKYSLAHLTVLGCAPPEMIYIASMAGYDHVSIRPILMGVAGERNYALAEQPEMLEQTKRAIAETGVTVHDIELARVHDEIDIKTYEPAMAVGKDLGAKCIISSVWTTDKDYYTRTFADLCDLAAKYDLIVGLEFLPFGGLKTLAEAKELLAAVNRPNSTHMIDTLHFDRSRVNLEELDGIPKEQLRFAHICDGPAERPAMDDRDALIHTARDARFYVGEGGIDIAGIIGKLPEDITLSVELPHLKRVAEYGYAEHARRCLKTAKEYFVKHGMG